MLIHKLYYLPDDNEYDCRRSWWGTAASVFIFLITVSVALSRCFRLRGNYLKVIYIYIYINNIYLIMHYLYSIIYVIIRIYHIKCSNVFCVIFLTYILVLYY